MQREARTVRFEIDVAILWMRAAWLLFQPDLTDKAAMAKAQIRKRDDQKQHDARSGLRHAGGGAGT